MKYFSWSLKYLQGFVDLLQISFFSPRTLCSYYTFPPCRVCTEVSKASEQGITDIDCIAKAAMAPFSNFVNELWWEAAVPPEKCDSEIFKDVLKKLVSESYGKIRHNLTQLYVQSFIDVSRLYKHEDIDILQESKILVHPSDTCFKFL